MTTSNNGNPLLSKPVIGRVTTKAKWGMKAVTYDVIQIAYINGRIAYVTNQAHKTHQDGYIEPVVIIDELVETYEPMRGTK